MAMRKGRLKKILMYSGLSLVSLLVVGVIFFFVFLEEIINKRMADLLERKFGSYYSLEYSSLEKDIGFNGITFVVKNAKLSSDTLDMEGIQKFPILFFRAEELRIENINIWDILWGNDLDLRAITLTNPDFDLFTREAVHKKSDSVQTRHGKGLLSNLRLGTFQLINGHVEVHDFIYKRRILINDAVNIRIDDIALNLNRLDEFREAFTYGDFLVEGFHSELIPAKGLYQFSMDSVRMKGNEQKLEFKNIKIETKKNLKEASRMKLNHSEVLNLVVENADIYGFDFSKLIYQNEISIEKIEVEDAAIHIFKNNLTYMQTDFKKEVFNQIFRNIKYPISIDSVVLKDVDLEFELMATYNKKPAMITLDSIQGLITNFSTKIIDSDTLKIKANAILMKEGKLNLNVEIAIQDSVKNYQKFWGNLQAMSFSVMNPTIQNFVNIKVKSGYVRRVDFVGYTNENKSWGSIAFNYRDLAMDIYSFKDPNKKKKNAFLSSVAKMAIYKTNPLPNGDYRTALFEYKKERWEGSVMLWIGGILTGMFKTTLKDFALDILHKETDKKVQENQKEVIKTERFKEKTKNKKT